MSSRKRITGIAAAVIAALALAGCGTAASTSSTSSPASQAPAAAPTSAAPAPLTCSTVTSDNGLTASQVIAQLVTDQKSQDAQLEQGWVDLTDGTPTNQGTDLQGAASALGSYAGTQLAADGSQLATDAQAFLTDQSGGLMPGWPSEYDAVAADIHKLASDCGMPFPVGSAGGQ